MWEPPLLSYTIHSTTMEKLDRIVGAIDRLAQAFVVFMVASVTAIMLAQVFFRKVLNSSLQWSEELSLFGLVWIVFIGAVVLMRNWEHINIPTFVNVVPIKARVWFIAFSKLASIVFLAFLIWYGFDVFSQNFHANSPSLGVSTKWAKLSIPVGSVLMVLFGVNVLLKDFIEYRRKNYEHFEHQGNPGLE
jgi:TRAP-type C4-dicarboxylate transport system permease small subunit